MSLHSVYNIVALAAFALGAAALITAAILFVSQRLWEVMSDRRKRPASAHRTGSHTAKAHTPPQPVGGWNTTALNRSANAADGTRPMNGQSSFAPGTMPMNGQANAAPGTMPMNGQVNTAPGTRPMNGQSSFAPGTRPMNSQANTANRTTLLNSQADVAAGTTMLKTKPAAPPTASGGTVPLKPSTASGGTVPLNPSTASGGTVPLKPSTASGGTVPLKPPTASGGTTMLRVTPGAPAARVRRAEDVVSAHVLGAYAASIRPNRSEPPAAFRIVKDEVVVHTSEVI